jgi:hypothetical protein
MSTKIYTARQWLDLWKAGRLVIVDDRAVVDHVPGWLQTPADAEQKRYGRDAVLFVWDEQPTTAI